jgi:hypothetical protein
MNSDALMRKTGFPLLALSGHAACVAQRFRF